MSEMIIGNKKQWSTQEREQMIKSLMGRYCVYLDKQSNKDLSDIQWCEGAFTVGDVLLRNK